MNKGFELNSFDMVSFLIQAMIGIRLLTLPREIARWVQQESWIPMLIGAAVVMVLSYMLYWLGIQYPGKNGSQIFVDVFGEKIGLVGLIAIGFHTVGSMGLGLRIFGSSLKLFLLPYTPMYVTMGVMLFLSVYATLKGLKVIASLMNVITPQVLFFFIFMLLLPIGSVEVQNVRPFFQHDVKTILLASLEVIDALYGFTIIIYLMPYFKKREETKKWVFVGTGIPIAIYLGMILMCILVFGGLEITRLIYPTLSLAKSVRLEVQIFERAESLFMIGWVISTFSMQTLSLFVSYENLKVLFKTKKNQWLIYGQIPIIWAIAFFPENTAQVQTYNQYVMLLGRSIMLGIIPGLVAATYVKERRKKHEA